MDRIELAFLVPGHSYLPCDRKFGNISKKLAKSQTIASPASLIALIKGRSSGREAFNVTEMQREDIFNLDVFTETSTDQRVVKIRSQDKAFSNASLIVLKAGVPNGYLLKKTFEEPDEVSKFIDVQLPKVTENLDLGLIELEPKYQE